MSTFEQRIADAVNEKLNDGTVERLVREYVEKGVSEALGSMFSYEGDGRRIIAGKLNDIIVPAIERHDFNRYLLKLDTVLTEVVNATVLADNQRILENFKDLMKEPETGEIRLSDIFEQYCRYVASDIDTDGLKVCCDDGEPYYGNVTANMEVEHENKIFRSAFDDCTVRFTCEEDEKLNFQTDLCKGADEKYWHFSTYRSPVDINSLRMLDKFEVFLMTLKRGCADIIMDVENDCNDDIKPEGNPE